MRRDAAQRRNPAVVDDTTAIDAIVEILTAPGDWDFDHLDAIADVLDVVRDRWSK